MTANPIAVTTADLDPERLFTRVRYLRMASIAEAVSYLVLLVAAVVKRTAGSEIGVEVMGPIHGILFLAFALVVVLSFRQLGWTVWRMVGALFLGSLPFGGFWIERRWLPRRYG
jgi:integral membrane protein